MALAGAARGRRGGRGGDAERVEQRNALTRGMADELIAAFDEVDAKPEVGA
jgi:hypothetical protein